MLTFFAILLLVPDHDTTHTTEYWERAGVIAALGIYAVWFAYAVIPRCRDIGLPWFAAFGMLIPLLNLIFFGALVIMRKSPEEVNSFRFEVRQK